ncbi:glyoxylate/hydroxypyruvate reductase B-like [Anneissia japonica]|uniref:glyoxylate/hydroxypyruvate reductase B-like n=1 Tax=Anneissia japonica TaxID=1529436 RepID=UPI001425A637|nr:glyoxylate/hydroxypyruvate reductase B-like [Anneissia japonica]
MQAQTLFTNTNAIFERSTPPTRKRSTDTGIENTMSSSVAPTILCSSVFKNMRGIELFNPFKIIWSDEFFQKEDRFSDEIVGCLCTSRFVHLIDDNFLSMMPNLKVISLHSAGIDTLDVQKMHQLNIRVANIPHLVADTTADMAFTLILATARKLKKCMKASEHPDAKVRSYPLDGSLGTNVTGSSLGILGMGSIGYCVAKRALGFRMKTFYYNRNRRSELDEEHVNATYCSTLEELLKKSDFLVLAVPLTPETTNIIGQKELAIMKPTSILINVSRGHVVDTDALVDALKNSTISAAGLDVTAPEPLPLDHPLIQMDNVVLSGHTGTATAETRSEMLKQTVKNLEAGINGEPMNNEL